MYFWKIDALKKDLAEKPLSESDSFKYLLVTTIVYSLAIIPAFQNTLWDVYAGVATGIINVAGLFYIYHCNKRKNGENFLQRYLAIGWVVGVRWCVLFAFPALIVFYAGLELFSDVSFETSLKDVVCIVLLSLSYFWIFGKHMKDLVRMKAQGKESV